MTSSRAARKADETVRRYVIGIDPGVNTGFAQWDRVSRRLERAETRKLHSVLLELSESRAIVEVWLEDGRLRSWFGHTGSERWQGVGSIKRDCSAIEAACIDWGIPYKLIKPKRGATKWTPEYFHRITGWESRTSEHARDAVALVYGAK